MAYKALKKLFFSLKSYHGWRLKTDIAENEVSHHVLETSLTIC